jgi:hypothetical protein
MREPRASRSRWWIGVLVFAALFWTLDLGILRGGVPHPLDDGWEDGLIARNLVSGVGFRSHMLYPPLWPLRDPRTLTVPVLIHGPLLPILTAPVISLLGPRALDRVAWAAGLLAALVVLPLFRLVARRFGEPAAAMACMLWTLSPLTLEAVHHSLSVILGAFLFVGALERIDRDPPRALAGGILAGLGLLVRPEMLLAAPLLAALTWRNARSVLPAARFVAGFVVCALPWWVHHALVTGSPFFNLSSYTLIGYWGDRPGVSVLNDFSLTLDRWPAAFRAALPSLPRKWIAFAPYAAKHALFAPSGGTGWLAIFGIVPALRARETRTLALFSAGLAAIPLLSMTIASHQPLYLVPFLPLYATAAAIGIHVVMRALPRWAHRPRAEIGALLLLLLPSILPALREGWSESRILEARLARERGALAAAGLAPRGNVEPMFSDTPDFVAWTTHRPVFWTTRDQFERLYRPGSDAPKRFTLPPRDRATGWFHEDARDPAEVGKFVTP